MLGASVINGTFLDVYHYLGPYKNNTRTRRTSLASPATELGLAR